MTLRRKFLLKSAIIVLCAVAVFGALDFLLIRYSAEKLLKDNLTAVAAILKEAGKAENADFSRLASGSRDIRITFIREDGAVVADTAGDISENHLDRPEVAAALSGSPAFFKRRSKSLGKAMIYYAESFSDYYGGVFIVRTAVENSSSTAAAAGLLPFLLLLAAGLAVVLILVNGRYNNVFLPFDEIKNQLHKINTGEFKRITVAGKDDGRPPALLNEINEVAERINRLNKIRSIFFANASHELNTPLTSISGYAELMENGFITDGVKIKEYGAKIRREAENMNNLVKDMLKISALENPEIQVELKDVDMKNLLESVLETFSPLAASKNVTVKSYCFIDAAVSNERLLNDILANLVQNAIRYNKDGGRVDITLKKSGKNMEISVTDTGIGIAKEDQARLFERFYRVDRARSRETGGTGLGLSIVRHSAEKLSGGVFVESVVGKGSCFTVLLPLKHAI